MPVAVAGQARAAATWAAQQAHRRAAGRPGLLCWCALSSSPSLPLVWVRWIAAQAPVPASTHRRPGSQARCSQLAHTGPQPQWRLAAPATQAAGATGGQGWLARCAPAGAALAIAPPVELGSAGVSSGSYITTCLVSSLAWITALVNNPARQRRLRTTDRSAGGPRPACKF